MDESNLDSIFVDDELKEQLKALVVERINVMPDSMRLAIGDMEFEKKDIISHVEHEDEIGKQMMSMELDFLRDLASGAVYQYE